MEVSLGLVITESEANYAKDIVKAIRESSDIDVHTLTIKSNGPPKGHAAKLARAFMATKFGDDVVTIVDIDYYLLWFDKWSAHLQCTPQDGLMTLGYNMYVGGPDEGKYPMYLGTARSSTFAHFLNPTGITDFNMWLHEFKGSKVFDTKESPFNSWGIFPTSLYSALFCITGQCAPCG